LLRPLRSALKIWVFNGTIAYRDKKVVGVFVQFFIAPLQLVLCQSFQVSPKLANHQPIA
jgi:hypothetical protein